MVLFYCEKTNFPLKSKILLVSLLEKYNYFTGIFLIYYRNKKYFLPENIYWNFILNLPEKCTFLPDGLFIAKKNHQCPAKGENRLFKGLEN